MLRLLTVIALCLVAGPVLAAGVGLRTLTARDPVGGDAMPVAVFHPSPATVAAPLSIGAYELDAVRDAPIAGGRHPVILLSHGNMGNLWGHHALASALARAGFMTATVLHPGDNHQDFSRMEASSTIKGRPLQVSAALTAILADPVLGAHADKGKVGFVGFSAGGLTGAFLAGARPDFPGLPAYCATRVRDHGLCEDGLAVRDDRPDLSGLMDARIGAFVLLAPLVMSFVPESLPALRAPALIVVGGRDRILDPEANGRALARLWPGAVVHDLPEAAHLTFLSPCSARLARSEPVVCEDPPGIDRAALHRKLNDGIASFLRRSLAVE